LTNRVCQALPQRGGFSDRTPENRDSLQMTRQQKEFFLCLSAKTERGQTHKSNIDELVKEIMTDLKADDFSDHE
jgi:hypothetical protein